MPELPEIFNLAHQMSKELTGKKIAGVEVRQVKCLNIPAREFEALVTGATISSVTSRGKWVFVCDSATGDGSLLAQTVLQLLGADT